MKESLDLINQQGVSIVIGSRNEQKTLPLTINSLMCDMEASGITKWEFILMDNGSEDETSRFFAWRAQEKGRHWKYQYSPRGLVAEGRLRIFFDPIFSNVGTRNNGARNAKYQNIIFADAHIGVKYGTILSTLTALNNYGGIIHAPVSWMGSSSFNPQPGYQYSYKVGEKIWGTWNKLKIAETPFYIPITGHCWVAVKKKEFLEKGGYPQAQRVYGGGEPYLDTKWWMTGSTSMCDPGSLVYHLSAGRDYNWHSNDLIHNMFLVSYILGGKKWADRILITYLNKSGAHPDFVKRLYEEALVEGEADRQWLEKNKIMEFEELLRLDWKNDCNKCTKRRCPEPHPMRIWDIKNEELHGYHRSYVTEFQLSKREDGIIRIGETPITEPQAIELALKYI